MDVLSRQAVSPSPRYAADLLQEAADVVSCEPFSAKPFANANAPPVEVDALGGGVLRDQAGSTLTVVASDLCYLEV